MTHDPYGPYDPPSRQPGQSPQYPQPPGGQGPQGPWYPQSPPPQSPAPYPPDPTAYPQGPGGYPPGPAGYPPAPAEYPPTPAGYPQAPGGGYPAGGYPPAADQPTAPMPPGYGGYGGTDGPYGGAPGGWPAPPAGPPPRRRRTGLVVGLVAAGVALVLCVGVLGVVGLRALRDADLAGGSDDPGGSGEAAVAADPFADTPAAGFAEGVDGIQLPEAQAVGDFTADEVAQTLDQVREALIATRIDQTMLLEHDPEPFLALMSEDNQPLLRQEFDGATFAYFASQVAEGAELAVATPRVQGEITYEATLDDQGFRVIEVVTSFVWAYAFVVPDDDPELDGIVVVRDELVWQVPHRDDVAESSLGLWLWEGEAYASGIDCDAFDRGLLAPQTETRVGVGGPDEADIFDPGSGLDFPDTC